MNCKIANNTKYYITQSNLCDNLNKLNNNNNEHEQQQTLIPARNNNINNQIAIGIFQEVAHTRIILNACQNQHVQKVLYLHELMSNGKIYKLYCIILLINETDKRIKYLEETCVVLTGLLFAKQMRRER